MIVETLAAIYLLWLASTANVTGDAKVVGAIMIRFIPAALAVALLLPHAAKLNEWLGG